MAGVDRYEMMDQELSLNQVLEHEVRPVAEAGSPFLRVGDFFPH